jgi:excisionase family DNA binding protein
MVIMSLIMPVIVHKRLLDTKTASEYLSISRSLLYQWIRAGKIPCININTRTLIDVEDLDQFIDLLKVKQKAQSK